MRDLLYKDLQARTCKPFLQSTPVASSAELELLEVACCQHSVQLNKIRVPAQVCRNAAGSSCASCLGHVRQDQKCAYDETARNKTWASSDSLLREHTTVVKSSAPATKTQPLRESPQVTGWEVCEISPPSTTACSGAAFASSVAAYSTLVDVACSPLTAWAIALITTPRSPDCCGGEGGG